MTLHLPDGFSMRPPTLDDAKIVTDLLQCCQLAEYGVSHANEEDTKTLWQSPEMDLRYDAWLIFSPHHQLIAYLHLGHKEPLRMEVVLKVHPDFAHLGLQSPLLQCAEQRALELLPQVRPDARVSLNISCSGSDNIYKQAIEQAKFVYVRSNLRMEIEMNEPPPVPSWPEGIELRPFTQNLARAVHAADEEGFSDHWGYTPTSFEMFQHWYMQPSSFDPSLWFLAFADEKIVGSALCEQGEEIGWVNSLSVLRPWRRKGLALALLHQAFGEFYRRGVQKVALFVDAQSLTGATRLYERAGMHVVRQFDKYEKELRPGIELSTQTLQA